MLKSQNQLLALFIRKSKIKPELRRKETHHGVRYPKWETKLISRPKDRSNPSNEPRGRDKKKQEKKAGIGLVNYLNNTASNIGEQLLKIPEFFNLITPKSDKFIQNAKITPKEIHSYKFHHNSNKQTPCSIVVLKNPKSFIIVRISKELCLKLVEENRQIFSTKLKINSENLELAFYCAPLNCYFLRISDKIFRKDINGRPPYIYMCYHTSMYCFQYKSPSEKYFDGVRLVSRQKFRRMTVTNLKTRKVELNLRLKDRVGILADWSLVGELKDRLLTLTDYGYLCLHSLFPTHKSPKGSRTELCSLDFSLNRREELAAAVCSCPQSKHILVVIRRNNTSIRYISRFFVVRNKKDREMILEAKLVFPRYQLQGPEFLSCFGYVGRHLLFIGLVVGDRQHSLLVDYDTRSKELRELEETRVDHQERDPCCIEKLGDAFFYTGRKGSIMRLSIVDGAEIDE